eukprot:SAG22_NODE_288_length_12949_cov_163.316265_14_plen_281_part_00
MLPLSFQLRQCLSSRFHNNRNGPFSGVQVKSLLGQKPSLDSLEQARYGLQVSYATPEPWGDRQTARKGTVLDRKTSGGSTAERQRLTTHLLRDLSEPLVDAGGGAAVAGAGGACCCETARKGTVLAGKTVGAQQKGSALQLTAVEDVLYGEVDVDALAAAGDLDAVAERRDGAVRPARAAVCDLGFGFGVWGWFEEEGTRGFGREAIRTRGFRVCRRQRGGQGGRPGRLGSDAWSAEQSGHGPSGPTASQHYVLVPWVSEVSGRVTHTEECAGSATWSGS